tara:strand:+ start:2483 stop:3241 length:759 start_codon:yes stop_codon:yes gene_type:complete
MPVPGATANYLKNTTGGAFSAQTQGGTILSNQTTGDAITKALALKDNAADFTDIPTPKKSATTGSYGTEVVNAQGSNGTFAYNGGTAQGTRFPMIGYSTNLGGYANTAILSPGAEPENMVGRQAIHQFVHDFGADTTMLFRRGRYSYTGYKSNGDTKFKKRSANLFTAANGHTHATPGTHTGTDMYAPGGADRDGSGATARFTDAAANPTRAIPGRLVLQAVFAFDATNKPFNASVATDGGSDFYVYKPING